ncbi:vWA domain-containing protein [Sphaerisporangium corydalis]|uniref:von Willebrand factor type A domain-containing protein n=1 Tax=Sphaerisporangium corydalis TaxID=1441875 RepID=A0ABV9EIQ0_9ACTN|nr:von Willebrand factor type A domain-containing protein [Sphaerisporangium corydalis]
MKTRVLACVLIALALILAACGGSSNDTSGAREPAYPPAPANGNENENGRAANPTAVAPRSEPEPSARASSTSQGVPAETVSTFALDVDTASYGYARGQLKEGRLPEADRVRPEEFVNAFQQGYAEPSGDGFAVQIDGARGAADETALLRVGLQTRTAEAAARRPANLTFVVDVSGSMADPGRIDLVRDALNTLVDQLGPGDQVSIVSFSDEARVRLPMTPASRRGDLHRAIDALGVEGSTNLESGLVTGYDQAARAFRPVATNRVILLSDGLANTGDTSWQGILDRVEEQAGRQITLLCVGVGRDYGDALMEQLADNGDGAAVYVSSTEEARKIFVERLPANLDLRARDAKAQVVFNPATVASYRLLGYENRALAEKDFRDDSKDGGEVGPGHAVTALYAVRLRPGTSGQLAMASVRWQDPDSREPAEVSRAVEVSELSGALWEASSPRLQVDAVVAAFAERLRHSDNELFAEDLDGLAGHAERLAKATEDPMVTELADLIHKAGSLR